MRISDWSSDVCSSDLTMLPTILALQNDLAEGQATSVKLTEAALARIADPSGEGSRAFTETWPEQALAAARASDILRAAGLSRSPIEGLPISIKDLRSEEHTSELQSLMRTSYAVFFLK